MVSHERSKEEHQDSRASDLLAAWLLREPTPQPDAWPLIFLSSEERRLIAAVIGVNNTTVVGALCLRYGKPILFTLMPARSTQLGCSLFIESQQRQISDTSTF